MSRPFAEASPAAEAARGAPSRRVRKRHVFYISGFDPKGPAHYHRLYADQAELAGAVGGYRADVGKRRRLSEHAAGWTARFQPTPARPAEQTVTVDSTVDTAVHTAFEFLRWDDIVRDHWPRNPAVLALDLVATTLLYLRSGALWKMFKLSWPPVVALVVPFLILLGLVFVLPLAAVAGWAVGRATGSWPAGVAVALALCAAALAGARLAEQRLNMRWLLRSYAFTGRQGTRGWPVLEARLDAFGQAIAQRVARAASGGVDDACDEVLIVAHSSGSIMAVSALARALALDPQLTQRGPRVSLLTLGHWTPLLSSLPHARAFRAELARLAHDVALDWVDFTAPADGCCFALTDPTSAAGEASTRTDHPRLLSPRFAAMFSPATYAEIKRDRFRLHFQYLMATELPGDYDYVAITAGPLGLRERFEHQASVTDFKQFRVFA